MAKSTGMTDLRIRPETISDHAAIRRVNRRAFGLRDEADLVDRLRATADPFLSLVAELDDEVVGHILFTPAHLERHSDITIFALAPMAVDPRHQGRGVGSRLVRAGLQRCEEEGADAVVVLGHPGYYPRFGFEPAHRFGLRFEPPVPRDAFMAMELETGVFDEAGGVVHYHAEFDRL